MRLISPSNAARPLFSLAKWLREINLASIDHSLIEPDSGSIEFNGEPITADTIVLFAGELDT